MPNKRVQIFVIAVVAIFAIVLACPWAQEFSKLLDLTHSPQKIIVDDINLLFATVFFLAFVMILFYACYKPRWINSIRTLITLIIVQLASSVYSEISSWIEEQRMFVVLSAITCVLLSVILIVFIAKGNSLIKSQLASKWPQERGSI